MIAWGEMCSSTHPLWAFLRWMIKLCGSCLIESRVGLACTQALWAPRSRQSRHTFPKEPWPRRCPRTAQGTHTKASAICLSQHTRATLMMTHSKRKGIAGLRDGQRGHSCITLSAIFHYWGEIGHQRDRVQPVSSEKMSTPKPTENLSFPFENWVSFTSWPFAARGFLT